jgi:hypothetical protein
MTVRTRTRSDEHKCDEHKWEREHDKHKLERDEDINCMDEGAIEGVRGRIRGCRQG